MDDYIERAVFIEDVKTEIMNLYLDGKKGTPRGTAELYDLIDRIKEQPAADVMVVAPVMRKVVKRLHDEYDKAIRNPVVRNPLAYALFQVWKEADQQEVRRE